MKGERLSPMFNVDGQCDFKARRAPPIILFFQPPHPKPSLASMEP
jgi:hypothetical protein